jgi:hypothetical protein
MYSTSLFCLHNHHTLQITEILLALPGVDSGTPVIDGTACVGGNVISFAAHFEHVSGALAVITHYDSNPTLCCLVSMTACA